MLVNGSHGYQYISAQQTSQELYSKDNISCLQVETFVKDQP